MGWGDFFLGGILEDATMVYIHPLVLEGASYQPPLFVCFFGFPTFATSRVLKGQFPFPCMFKTLGWCPEVGTYHEFNFSCGFIIIN